MNYSLNRISAVHSMPFCTPSGRLISKVGWDEETQIYLNLPFDYAPFIPENPTASEVRKALVVMMSPWKSYSFSTPDDAAAMVSAVLTAVCRVALTICPAVGMDASTQGSGKTLAATALGSLMTGRVEGVTPFGGFNDEELVKQFISGVLISRQFYCLDNLIGYVKSPALAGILTSGRLRGRVLGASREIDAPIRALITMTFNNGSLSADMLRRVMKVRINSGSNPALRRFSFTPPDVAIRDRLKIAEAACVIWRAYFAAGAPQIASDDAGGYGDWVKLCRQPVLWLVREGLTDQLGWPLGDPAASSMTTPAEDSDPEIESHEDMLRALFALSDGSAFSSRDALAWMKAGATCAFDAVHSQLHEALTEILAPGRSELTAKQLGKAFSFRRDRVVAGFVLRKGLKGRDGTSWTVQLVGPL